MHCALDELRSQHPGKWLLIRLDGPNAEEGTLLSAHEDSEALDATLEKWPYPQNMADGPLYLTYSIPDGEQFPAFAL